MENLKVNDEIMGELIYKKDYWLKLEPIRYSIDYKEKFIVLEIDILDREATEYELGIGGWEDDDFEEDELLEHDEYKKKVNDMYKKYIECFDQTIKLIENIIIDDYNIFIKENDEQEVLITIGEENYKSIIGNVNNVFNLIELKKIRIFKDRIRIIGLSKWYINGEFGINLWKDDSYNIGNLDTIY